MKEIFEQYGGMIITIVAILTVILVVRAVIGSDQTGIVGKAFGQLIDTFLSQAQMAQKGTLIDGTQSSVALGIWHAVGMRWI